MCGQRTIHKRPLTFCATAGPSVSFRQFSVRLQDLLSTSVKLPCVRLPSTFRTNVLPCILSAYVDFTGVLRTICQLFVRLMDIPSPFVNFPCVRGNLRQILCQQNILSSSVNILCICVILRQLFVHQRDIKSTFLDIHETFRQLSVHPREHASNFRVSVGQSIFRSFVVPSVKFGQLFVYQRYLLSTFDNILCIHGTSQIDLCGCWNFRQLQSTIRATLGPFVNFP